MFNLTLQNQEIQMTSLEISELTGSRHDSVKRTIERLSSAEIIARPPMVVEQSIDANGQRRFTDVLVFSGNAGKRDSIVVVARLSPEFTARLVDRWQELESQLKSPALPNFSNPAEAARAWADQMEAKQIAQQQLATAAPKIAYFDQVVNRDQLLNATQVAQKLGMSAIEMNKYLDDLGVYSKNVQRSRVFKQGFINRGYGIIRQTESGYPQAMFTLKGEAWIIQKLTSEGIVA